MDTSARHRRNYTLSITNSIARSNGGGTFKWGAAPTNVIFTNNLSEANCNRMGFPLTGAPTSYNANLADFCRSGDAVSFNLLNNGKVLMANNTFITYASTSFDISNVNDGNSYANECFNLRKQPDAGILQSPV